MIKYDQMFSSQMNTLETDFGEFKIKENYSFQAFNHFIR